MYLHTHPLVKIQKEYEMKKKQREIQKLIELTYKLTHVELDARTKLHIQY